MSRILFYFSFLCFAANAYADSSIKELVFEDCDKLEYELTKLDEPNRRDFITYLGKVLKMQLGASAEFSPGSNTATAIGNIPQPAGTGDMKNSNLWRIFDPTREINAKKCAVKIIAKTKPQSVFIIPDMIALSDDITFKRDFRENVKTVIWEVWKTTINENINLIDENLIKNLINLLGNDIRAYFAENLLIEIHSRAFPYLLNELSTKDLVKRNAIFSLLKRFNVLEDSYFSELIPQLQSTDEDMQARVLDLLLSGNIVINQLQMSYLLSVSNQLPVNIKKTFLLKLQKKLSLPQVSQELDISDEQFLDYLSQIKTGPTELREFYFELISLFLQKNPERAGKFSDLLLTEDSELSCDTLEILGRQKSITDDVYKTISEEIFSKKEDVAVCAISALVKLQNKSEETLQLLLKVLKSNTKEKELIRKQRFVLAVAEQVKKMPLDKVNFSAMNPYFIEALSYESITTKAEQQKIANSAYEILLMSKEDISPALKKLLQKGNVLEVRRAIGLLANIGKKDVSTLKALISLFERNDPQINRDLKEVLMQYKELALNEIKKHLNAKDLDTQRVVAEVLLESNVVDTKIQNIIRDSFAKADCQQKAEILPYLLKADTSFKTGSQMSLLECLRTEQNIKVILNKIGLVVPLSQVSQDYLFQLLQNPALTQETRNAIILELPGYQLPDEVLAPVLFSILKNSDEIAKKSVVDILLKKLDTASAIKNNLHEIAKTKEIDVNIKNKIKIVLYQIAANKEEKEEVEEYFKKEVDSKRYQWALESLLEAKNQNLLPLLLFLLKESDDEKKASLISVIGKYGDLAKPAFETLMRYINSEDSFLSYQAVLALLRIDSTTANIANMLSDVMLGRYGQQMLLEKFDKTLKHVFQEISEKPKTKSAELLAKELLYRMDKLP